VLKIFKRNKFLTQELNVFYNKDLLNITQKTDTEKIIIVEKNFADLIMFVGVRKTH
jgi:hypothetical protein